MQPSTLNSSHLALPLQARPLQTVPYSRADVELLIDAEEQQAFEGLALQALESVAGGGAGADVPLSALMSAVPAAARAAAAAYNSAWVDYELSDARQDGGTGGTGGVPVLDGSDPREAQKMGRRLASIAGNEVLQLPFYEALLSAAQAAAAPGMADLLASGEDASSVLQAAVDAQRPVLRQTEAAAWALATSAAARAIGQQLQRLQASGGSGGDSSGGSGGGPGADTAGAAAATGPCLNTASERGVETQSPAEVLGEGGRSGAVP